MSQPDLVKTGIVGLDDILSNGIPRGNVILVEGAIGVGKTTMGVEFVYRGASQFDEPGIIVVFEVSPDKIMRDALHHNAVVFLSIEIEVLSDRDDRHWAIVLNNVFPGTKDRSCHPAVAVRGDGLCRWIEPKSAKLAKFFAELEATLFWIEQPDASKLIASSTPISQDVNVLISEIGASGQSLHALPLAVIKVFQRLLGISAKDLHLAHRRVRIPVFVCVLRLWSHIERELRQVGCDFELERCAMREVFGDGLWVGDL
jgi:KaiC